MALGAWIRANKRYLLKIISSKQTNPHKRHSGKEPVQITPMSIGERLVIVGSFYAERSSLLFSDSRSDQRI